VTTPTPTPTLTPTPPERLTPERPEPARPHASPIPWIVIGAGAALAGIGLVYDVTEVQPARDRLELAETVDAFRGLEPEFRSARNVAIGLIAGGALVATVGVVLKLTLFTTPAQVSASVTDGGAAVLVGWRR